MGGGRKREEKVGPTKAFCERILKRGESGDPCLQFFFYTIPVVLLVSHVFDFSLHDKKSDKLKKKMFCTISIKMQRMHQNLHNKFY